MFSKKEICRFFYTPLIRSGRQFVNFYPQVLKPAKWRFEDLPIHPRVAGPHKELSKALKASRGAMQSSGEEVLCHEIKASLDNVRKVNWHEANCDGLDPGVCKSLQNKLEELISFEKRLPKSMLKQLGSEQRVKSLFKSLRDAIICLEDRSSKQPKGGDHCLSSFSPGKNRRSSL